MGKRIPLSVPNLKGKELEYVTKAIKSEWVSTAGPFITEFEEKISEYLGVESAVACQSGTSGIHLALIASGVFEADEVIVPTLTFIAAVNPVRYIGAEPIFMDCDDSLTMNVDKLRNYCTTECELQEDKLINLKSGRHIKAIIVVHIFGNMADMEGIMEVAKQYHLKVIEDATEALGTYYTQGKYQGRFAGTIGDFGVFSFNGNKIITTGGGGMLVSGQHPEQLQYCRYLSTQAKNDDLYFVHNEVGFNYRMTNLQAALGLAQLEQLEGFIKIKRENYMLYQKLGIPLLEFRKGTRPNYWFYSYFTNERDLLLKELEERQIQTRPIWKLIHTLKPYQETKAYQIENAHHYYNHILNLPCSSNLSEEEVGRVVKAIKQFEAEKSTTQI